MSHQTVQRWLMGNGDADEGGRLTASTEHGSSISVVIKSRVRRVSKRVFQKETERKERLRNHMTHVHNVDDTHICVDATNWKAEHSIEIRARESKKSDQITYGKQAGE